MRRFGEFLALSVPGLAEGRPSLLTGDKVVLSAPGLEDESPEYEGFVHDVSKFFHESSRHESRVPGLLSIFLLIQP